MLRFLAFLAVAGALIWVVIAGPLSGPVQGALQPLGRWLLAWQAEFQGGLARELRGVHGGQAAAFWALMGLCLTYGFVHAAGPGHGKALIGAYGVARRVPALKLAGIGLLAALAQGTAAVLIVLVLAGIAGMGRTGIESVDRGLLAMLGLAAMGLVGLWLIWRALQRIAAASRLPAQASPHHHAHGDEACAECGHAHLPPASAMLAAANGREVAALVAAVAVRPCSGALILLLLTWQMGLLWVGILGAYAMALGTAGVAAGLALALALGRDGLLAGAGRRGGAAGLRLAAGIEALAGLTLVLGVAAVAIAGR